MSLLPIYIMGKKYEVPEGYTILKAFEYAEYQLIRGCGCRGGCCGACATVYRTGEDYHLRVGLACQTPIEAGMYLTQIPFYPAQKAIYDMDKIEDPVGDLLKYYPELTRCVGCNSCTKACPQGLQVMNYMGAALRGDFEEAAELSFDCLMCGICASRCPAETVQYNIGIFVRRAYAKYLAPKSDYVTRRADEIREGKHTEAVKKLTQMDTAALKELYAARDIVKEKY